MRPLILAAPSPNSSAVSPAPTKMGNGTPSHDDLSQVLILRPPETAKPHFS